MGYIYDFDLGTLLFFGLTLFFYLYQKRLRNLLDSIFTAMLICSMTAVVFDLVAAIMEYEAMLYPVWLLYVVNMLFIFGMQTCLPLFFLYAVASAGKFNRLSTWKRVLFAIPYGVTMALLLLSPFIGFGVCWIDGEHIYRHGATHWVLYVNMGVYVLAGISVLLYNGRNIQRAQRNVILLFAGLLFVAMGLQLAFPRYLVTASATALALTSVFYALQSPVDQLNPLTGAFSRMLLPALLQDYAERGRLYTLLLFSIHSFDEFVRLYGDDAGDLMLRAYSGELMERFPQCPVVYMDTSEFTVVYGRISPQELESLRAETPNTVELEGIGTVRLDVCLGAVPCAENDITIGDYMLREIRAKGNDAVLFADEEYRRACTLSLELEASLARLFEEKEITPLISPILTPKGQVALEEAQLWLCGERARYVSPLQFRQAVGQSGLAPEYYRTLFTAMAERRQLYSADRRLCVPLLPAAFLQADAPQRLVNLVRSLEFRPEQLVLSISEADAAAAESALRDNIQVLSKEGFAFMIDAFAQGYTDMSLMISLPLRYARLHESFAENAAEGADGAKLLKGLISVLTDVGVRPICSGVHSAAARQAALDAGAELLEGRYSGCA